MSLSTKIITQDDRLIIGRSQDCTAILEDAKRRHLDGAHGTADVKHAARIPNVIVEKYCNDNKITFHEFMGNEVHIKRLVEHPDNSMFRIWPGKL